MPLRERSVTAPFRMVNSSMAKAGTIAGRGAPGSARPLATLAILGALGVGLAAPKLLPLLDGFGKAPRLIESTEVLDPGGLIAILTSRDQGFSSRPARVTPYGWHEWGLYIGAPFALVLLAGFVFASGKREAWLKAENKKVHAGEPEEQLK